MYRFISFVGISSLAAAAVIQQPLIESDPQTPLIGTSKELVSSKALEAHITQKNLLKRAKELFRIAELGADDYNHPTRVIGSKGKLPLHFWSILSSSANATVAQDTSLQLIISTPRSQT